ncbi:MAG: Crp/Fnr family transcriptional regulator [Deltaproteobacteria bacterium]|nr:Crp/Fnr family transcriptional regulator [Deltaproteobacteria bacterium]
MATYRIDDELRLHPIWAEANPAATAILKRGARVEVRTPGQVFMVEGQRSSDIFLLTRGSVRLLYPRSSRRPELTAKLLHAPGVFGDIASIVRAPSSANIQALTPCVAIVVDAPTYFAAMHADVRVCFHQYWNVALRLAGAAAFGKASATASVMDRVVALLLAYGHDQADIELTQDDIADQVGTSRRTVVRLMESLYASGGLVRINRRYRITDVDKLLAVATPDLAPLSSRELETPWAAQSRR